MQQHVEKGLRGIAVRHRLGPLLTHGEIVGLGAEHPILRRLIVFLKGPGDAQGLGGDAQGGVEDADRGVGLQPGVVGGEHRQAKLTAKGVERGQLAHGGFAARPHPAGDFGPVERLGQAQLRLLLLGAQQWDGCIR